MAPRGLPKKGCCSGAGRRRPMGDVGVAAGSAEAEGTTATAETSFPPVSGWIASSDGEARGVISPSPQPGLHKIHQRKIHQR